MSNLDKLIFAWRLVRALRFSNPPEDSLSDLTKAYDSLTNVLLDCLECSDLKFFDSTEFRVIKISKTK